MLSLYDLICQGMHKQYRTAEERDRESDTHTHMQKFFSDAWLSLSHIHWNATSLVSVC